MSKKIQSQGLKNWFRGDTLCARENSILIGATFPGGPLTCVEHMSQEYKNLPHGITTRVLIPFGTCVGKGTRIKRDVFGQKETKVSLLEKAYTVQLK